MTLEPGLVAERDACCVGDVEKKDKLTKTKKRERDEEEEKIKKKGGGGKSVTVVGSVRTPYFHRL